MIGDCNIKIKRNSRIYSLEILFYRTLDTKVSRTRSTYHGINDLVPDIYLQVMGTFASPRGSRLYILRFSQLLAPTPQRLSNTVLFTNVH